MKKIAVLICDRQGEALRMSVGLTLVDDVIDVFVLDVELEQTEENKLNLELMKEIEMNTFSNNTANQSITYLPIEEIAHKLVAYDHVLAY
ncbi:MAG: hypothetical protein BMS9Abin11_1133 [Gammaproteobacteria bacterium]|nr:MAG: hypothetical protein BMS9Abin11_1133 [Gammaproteobacteria bacterium]